MCGRYSLAEINELLRIFSIQELPFLFKPRFNIAPSQEAPVFIREGANTLKMMRWGLVPPWAKDPSIGHKMINAKAETLSEKPSFRKAFQSRRCLVPADGFYEWQAVPGRKSKIPMRIVVNEGEPFVFAGLWENSNTYTIITTQANSLLKPIHDRMPVIIPAEDFDTWLNPESDPQQLKSLLVPYPDAAMRYFAVSTRVNSPGNDSSECIQPVTSL